MKQYNLQWTNSVTVGHGDVGAGIDWQNNPLLPELDICQKVTISVTRGFI